MLMVTLIGPAPVSISFSDTYARISTDFQIRKRTGLGIYLVENSTRPIIIVRKKAAHAGRAWKVAYADFVTVMTALFIVLWLLNSSKQIQVAVGGYFKDRQAPPKEWEPTLQVRERTFL